MSDLHRGLQAISREPRNQAVVQRFIRFFAAVAVIPLFIYIIVFNLCRQIPSPSFSPPILAGIAAVLSLNLVTSLFAFLAVREPSPVVERSTLSTDDQGAGDDEDDASLGSTARAAAREKDD